MNQVMKPDSRPAGVLSVRAVATMAAVAAATGAVFGFVVVQQYLQARGG
jgi:hypothetical protein